MFKIGNSAAAHFFMVTRFFEFFKIPLDTSHNPKNGRAAAFFYILRCIFGLFQNKNLKKSSNKFKKNAAAAAILDGFPHTPANN
jgi:hypothetical protein